jgi:hypothetical protein
MFIFDTYKNGSIKNVSTLFSWIETEIKPKYSVSQYFLFIFLILIISTLAFCILENIGWFKRARKIQPISIDILSKKSDIVQHKKQMPSNDHNPPITITSNLTEIKTTINIVADELLTKNEINNTETKQEQRQKIDRFEVPLLMFLTFMVSFLNYGILPGVILYNFNFIFHLCIWKFALKCRFFKIYSIFR